VVKRCRLPRVLRVTLRAVVIELTRQVGRICRGIELCGMAVPARLEQSLELVIHVALITGNGLVRTHQRECCCRMTECRRLPHCRCVTGCAVMIKVTHHMVRVRWLGELCCVAWITVGECQCVIVVDVACSARRGCMHAGQGKACRAMVKLCRTPRGGCVTLQAIRTEGPGNVLGINGVVEVGEVAVDAICGQRSILAIGMALGTWHRQMRTRKRESRSSVTEC
jgi:hypothetical protein